MWEVNCIFLTDWWHCMNVFLGLGWFWSRWGLQCECGVDRRTGPTHGGCWVPRCIQVQPTSALLKHCKLTRQEERYKEATYKRKQQPLSVCIVLPWVTRTVSIFLLNLSPVCMLWCSHAWHNCREALIKFVKLLQDINGNLDIFTTGSVEWLNHALFFLQIIYKTLQHFFINGAQQIEKVSINRFPVPACSEK